MPWITHILMVYMYTIYGKFGDGLLSLYKHQIVFGDIWKLTVQYFPIGIGHSLSEFPCTVGCFELQMD